MRLQFLLAYIVKLTHTFGLTPNHVSVLGLVFAVLAAITYWLGRSHSSFLLIAAFFLIVSGFFDALDGPLARLFGQVTIFGGFLDSLLDRYADALVLVGIIFGWLINDSFWLFWGCLALIGSLLVSYSRARAEAAGVKMETIGLAERAERIIILVVASFLALAWEQALQWSVALLAFLTHLTIVQRIAYFRKALKKKQMMTPIV
jgi:archaetidylinositol phosphate synthase